MHVFILDPHPIFRRGLAASVALMSDVTSVGQAECVRDALEDPALLSTDLLILDPVVTGGMDVITAVCEAGGVKVLACTAECREPMVSATLRAGASGYLRKDTLTHDGLQAALAVLAEGATVIAPEVLSSVVGPAANGSAGAASHADPDARLPARSANGHALARLSDRERSVLSLIADGLPTREVAAQLNYSERTIKNVLHDTVKKLGARSRSQAVAQAVRDGLI